MTPKPLRENTPPSVYCTSPSITWATVPVHINCTNPACNQTHVIGANRPVCKVHHPFPDELKGEIEWAELQREREEKIEAKRFVLSPIFGTGNRDKTISQIKEDAYDRFSEKAVDTAFAELQEGNFDLY